MLIVLRDLAGGTYALAMDTKHPRRCASPAAGGRAALRLRRAGAPRREDEGEVVAIHDSVEVRITGPRLSPVRKSLG